MTTTKVLALALFAAVAAWADPIQFTGDIEVGDDRHHWYMEGENGFAFYTSSSWSIIYDGCDASNCNVDYTFEPYLGDDIPYASLGGRHTGSNFVLYFFREGEDGIGGHMTWNAPILHLTPSYEGVVENIPIHLNGVAQAWNKDGDFMDLKLHAEGTLNIYFGTPWGTYYEDRLPMLNAHAQFSGFATPASVSQVPEPTGFQLALLGIVLVSARNCAKRLHRRSDLMGRGRRE